MQIPSNISFDEAASIPLGMTTAYIGMYHKAPYGMGLINPVVPAGQGYYKDNPFVVLGGASSVGQFGSSPSRSPSNRDPTFACFFFLKISQSSNLPNFPVFRLSLLLPRSSTHHTFIPLVPRTFSIETLVISKLKSTRSLMKQLSITFTTQSPRPKHKVSPLK